MKWNRTLCEKCRVVFVPDRKDQTHCFRCLVEVQERKIRDEQYKNRKPQICVVCDEEFYDSNLKKTCSEGCSRVAAARPRRSSSKKKGEEAIVEANEKWVSRKESPKRKGKSLDYLNKVMEHNRVWDDKGWNHYLKGRKWDNI
jgi:hypothetical protein